MNKMLDKQNFIFLQLQFCFLNLHILRNKVIFSHLANEISFTENEKYSCLNFVSQKSKKFIQIDFKTDKF